MHRLPSRLPWLSRSPLSVLVRRRPAVADNRSLPLITADLRAELLSSAQSVPFHSLPWELCLASTLTRCYSASYTHLQKRPTENTQIWAFQSCREFIDGRWSKFPPLATRAAWRGLVARGGNSDWLPSIHSLGSTRLRSEYFQSILFVYQSGLWIQTHWEY